MNEMLLNTILSNKKNLERILDNLKEGIIAHDFNRRITYYNKKAEEITGYSRKEVLGRDCHEIHGRPFCGNRCSFFYNNPPAPPLQDHLEYPIDIVTKDGESRRVEMSVNLMKDENGQNFGVLAAFRDVTEILNLQLKLGEATSFSNIIGRDRKMLHVFQQIRDVAIYDSPVYIYGETGTGKELVANAIHNASHRAGAPFVPINCGALPENLVESELFGHVKGSFTGAISDKKGRFELADKGTILLDEVAELPKYVQVKLLRFLQDGIIEKVGGEKSISVDVRIISASNKDLKEELKKQRFREDLYYRLNVIPIYIPPLRDRKNDIPLLAEHFLRQIHEKKEDIHPSISKAALSIMMEYNWPGNVRELENAIHFAVIKCKGKIIAPDNLPMELVESQRQSAKRGPSIKLAPDDVKAALIKTGGNKAKAARLLGVGRATLYRFLNGHAEVMPVDL
ncbi:MAG: sigma-54-dependent Fis family transcriptional regulator [Deltaproteobacteria bacterium CG1_02_45_11]|nr:MAG: sigma-54-dependent Fis family transcriptional regulator [Deltaproteobacteria bacterium CG1_02_45_11]